MHRSRWVEFSVQVVFSRKVSMKSLSWQCNRNRWTSFPLKFQETDLLCQVVLVNFDSAVAVAFKLSVESIQRFYQFTLYDWHRKLVPLSRPIRCNLTKTNHDLVTSHFLCFKEFSRLCNEFSMAFWDIFLCSDWLL